MRSHAPLLNLLARSPDLQATLADLTKEELALLDQNLRDVAPGSLLAEIAGHVILEAARRYLEP